MRAFKKFDFWKDGIDLSVKTNHITRTFPIDERFSLADQLRRCVSSIPSNIAEGCGRSTDKELSRYIDIAIGSIFEAETQYIIAQKSGYITIEICDEMTKSLQSIARRLNAFKKTLRVES